MELPGPAAWGSHRGDHPGAVRGRWRAKCPDCGSWIRATLTLTGSYPKVVAALDDDEITHVWEFPQETRYQSDQK